MDSATLETLRPRDASADGIASSIERMDETLINLKADLASMQTGRRAMLLTSTSAAIDKHDARISTLHIDIERIETATDGLRSDLSVARGRERLVRLDELRTEAEEAVERFRTFWFDKYEAAARAIVDGIELERAAYTASGAFGTAHAAASDSQDVAAAGGVPHISIPNVPMACVSNRETRTLASVVILPAVTPGAPLAWPSGKALVRPKTGESGAYAQ